MKRLYLLIFFCGTSLHAMDNDVQIVPFEYDKHYGACREIMDQNLPRNYAYSVIHNPRNTVQVLIRSIRQTRSKSYDRVLGVIAYITTHSRITETQIEALAIDDQYQHQGYGTMLMHHVESIPTTNHHYIILESRACTRVFYRKLGYNYADPDDDHYYMRKMISKN